MRTHPEPLCLFNSGLAEVESLIRQSVEDVLKDSGVLSSRRDFLVNQFVEALESDASWVDVYGITGELKVPGLSEEGELGDTIDQIKHVGVFSRPSFLMPTRVIVPTGTQALIPASRRMARNQNPSRCTVYERASFKTSSGSLLTSS